MTFSDHRFVSSLFRDFKVKDLFQVFSEILKFTQWTRLDKSLNKFSFKNYRFKNVTSKGFLYIKATSIFRELLIGFKKVFNYKIGNQTTDFKLVD